MIAVARFFVLLAYFLLINTVLLLIFIVRPMHRNSVNIAGIFYSSMSKIVGIKLIVKTSPKIKDDASYTYIANHQNSYDIMTVSRAARPGVVTIGKKSLKWIPVFGLIYWLSGNIMIDRKNSGRARDTMLASAEKVKERNLSIFMFPEGTRSRGRGIMTFKTGAFRLAQATNQAIVPVVCSDLSDIRFNRWNNGTVVVELLDPVEVSLDESPKVIAKRFEDMYKEKLVAVTETAKRLSEKK